MHSRHRKRRNFVAQLVNGDQILTSHDDKAVLVDNFYARLIGECGDREQTINLEALHMPTFNLAHLTGMLIKAIKAIDKIRSDFLWRGRKEVRRGQCLVAWGGVCRPL